MTNTKGNATPQNTLIIKVGDNSFLHKGVRKEGYKIITPYIEWGVTGRLLREVCFRLPFMPKRIWYNHDIIRMSPEFILLYDVLVTRDFCEWLHEKLPNAQLNFVYGNLIGKAKHITPDKVPEYFRKWTYDEGDCKNYCMKMTPSMYFPSYVISKKTTRYDVLFIGKDKGRGDYLIELERKLQALGLKTKFIIVKDGVLSKKKSYYQKPVNYDELICLLSESRSFLNVILPGQSGVTMRDMETLFFKVKLLTTNSKIAEVDFFRKENIFIINNENIESIPDFLSLPMSEVPEEILYKHTFVSYVEEITRAIY